MALGRAQVSEWLHTMNLERYIQAFLDNGYDDMIVCRQIGHPDLEAIGVDSPADRKTILDHVEDLLEKDSSCKQLSHEYATLENPDYAEPPVGDTSSEEDEPPSLPPRGFNMGTGPLISKMKDEVSSLIMEGMQVSHTHGDGITSSDSYHGSTLQYSRTNKSEEGLSEVKSRLSGASSLEYLNRDRSDSVEDGSPQRKTSTLGRLFRMKKQAPKYTYKKHQGDLSASDITMSEDKRILLMLQVKQGKLSQEEVLKQVKIYEEQKRLKQLQHQMENTTELSGVVNQDRISSQKRHQSVFRTKLLPFLRKKHSKDKELSSVRKGSLPTPSCAMEVTVDYADTPRRGSLPVHSKGHTETSGEKFEGFRPSPDRIDTIPEGDDAYKESVYPHDDAVFKEHHMTKKQPIRRCQEDAADLNSDGMSQGESERTASSSLESVHSYSGGIPSLSSSSSQGSMTLDDSNISRHPICLARVLVDYVPSPYDKESLKLKKGELLQVLKKDISGTWLGKLNSRIGSFKFINVELLSENPPSPLQKEVASSQSGSFCGSPDATFLTEALLTSLKLQHLISVFMLNGYMTLNDLAEITEADLDDLHICQADDRSKIMKAVELINSGEVDLEHILSAMTNGVTTPTDESDSKHIISKDSISNHQSKSRIPCLASGKYSTVHHPPKHSHAAMTCRHVDSGLDVDSSLEADMEDEQIMSTGTRTLAQHSTVDNSEYCHNVSGESFRCRTLSQGHQTVKQDADNKMSWQLYKFPSRIPRGRASTVDSASPSHSPSQKSRKSMPGTRQYDLSSIVDSAYSSAPSTPVLQRNKGMPPSTKSSPSRQSHDTSGDLAAIYPHLQVVKTAHIRSLTSSRSLPGSTGGLSRISPAARSSVHAHPRAGKPPRLRSKGVEAIQVEPHFFTQGQSLLNTADYTQECSKETVTMAIILKTIGLSQYEQVFRSHGITTQHQFRELTEKRVRKLGIKNTEHMHKILSWKLHLDPKEKHDTHIRPPRVSGLRDKV